jgi:pimeloyl-ACP methyl ester carboxylesterase
VSSIILDFLGAPPATPSGGWGDGAAVDGVPAPPVRPSDAVPAATLTHHHSSLALHLVRDGSDDRPLLLLHGLGERTPTTVPAVADAWPGPVYGLDFTGHGASTIPVGGGYSAEILLADADAAVRHLGSCTVLGRGLGAYVALLLAAARPDVVLGTVLGDGPGLFARSDGPGSPVPPMVDRGAVAPPDPWALAELGRDIRTPDYAAILVRMALMGSAIEQPVTVAAQVRPAWLAAVADVPGVLQADAVSALGQYAAC